MDQWASRSSDPLCGAADGVTARQTGRFDGSPSVAIRPHGHDHNALRRNHRPLGGGGGPGVDYGIVIGFGTDVSPKDDTILAFWRAVQDTDRVKAFTDSRGLLERDRGLASTRDSDGNAPLHDAALRNDKAMVELLLTYGADVGATTSSGSTPLHYTEHPDVAEVLLRHGARINARNKDGWTPLDCVVYAGLGREWIIEFLRERGGQEAIEKPQNPLSSTYRRPTPRRRRNLGGPRATFRRVLTGLKGALKSRSRLAQEELRSRIVSRFEALKRTAATDPRVQQSGWKQVFLTDAKNEALAICSKYRLTEKQAERVWDAVAKTL